MAELGRRVAAITVIVSRIVRGEMERRDILVKECNVRDDESSIKDAVLSGLRMDEYGKRVDRKEERR